MNFVDADIVTEGDGPVARIETGEAIRLDPALALSSGRRVTLGLRPEHLDEAGGNELHGVVELVEPTGAQTHVTFQLAGRRAVAVVDGSYAGVPGDRLAARITPQSIDVFDRETGGKIARR